MRPSPARAEPHDPEAWFPLPALEELLAPDRLVDSGQTRAITITDPAPPVDPSPAPPEPAPRPGRSPRRPRGAAARRVDRATRRRRALILALAAATVAAGGATVPNLVAGADTPEVMLRVDGERLVVSTEAETVRGLLRQEGVAVGADDRVEPPLRTVVTDGLTVAVFRAFDLRVDFDGAVSEVRTTRRSVSRLQAELGLDPDQVAVTSAPDRLGAGALVAFRTLRDVTVNVDGASLTETTTGLTVAEVLDEYSIVLGPQDLVDPALDTRVTDDLVVTISRISDDLTETVNEPVPFPEERREDPSLPQGETAVAQEGVDGVQAVTYRITTADGTEIGREAISKVPVTPPVPQIVMVGTALPNQRVGTASWYASPFGDDSCATKEYVPKGTIVRVTNLDTGASTHCRVADRVEANRVVDLDDDVFAQLAPLSRGVFNARIDW